GNLLHVRFELVVLVANGVEKQAFEQVGTPLGLIHLVDEMGDLAHHVLEGAVKFPLGGHLAVQHFHDREQIAVERNVCAGRRADRSHAHAPKLSMADGSSACISRKFWAPVIVSMVSTRFCTPASLRTPPATVACRYRSIKQPMVALSTYVTLDRSINTFRSPPPIRDVI